MTQAPVLIAGGGIGGLSLALTLQQLGIPCVVLESVSQLQPLGVGINIQPNAIRELFDLGIDETQLDQVGVKTKEWALVGRNGSEIYSEPRGLEAGYHWPQYSVHRGHLQMLLYRNLVARGGAESVLLGHRVTGYRQTESGVIAVVNGPNDETLELSGSVLIAADGIHSAVRAQMYPNQPGLHWGGAVMYRGTSLCAPIRTGASFVGLGSHHHRMVIYPITPADPNTGLAVTNWIAEITLDNSDGWASSDWNRKVSTDEVVQHFADWNYDWMDVPALIQGAEVIYEYPMIDRDPVPSWQDHRVALLGDAAHAMYPTGSNGASQAIIDARVLGAAFLQHGVNEAALKAYDNQLCDSVSALILRNRGAGPFGLLNLVDDRCGGYFDNIDDIIPEAERQAFMADYKAAAGFAIDALNHAPATIPTGSRMP